MKTIAFAGSNSQTSINKQLVTYAVALYGEANILDLNDFNIPTYSIDLEKNQGFSEDFNRWYELLTQADVLLISFAEHNASFTAVFKSYMDWCSRKNPQFLAHKKIMALSTSPGGYAGRNALEAGVKLVTKLGGTVLEEFALPKFHENFKEGKIIVPDLDQALHEKVAHFKRQFV